VSSRRGTLESELEFLSDNDFIRATYLMVGKGVARVRIYVLPEDCEWYLIREPRKEYRGRALLKKLWELVDTNSRSWKGEHSDFQNASLLADDDISLNISTIFNTLPSPQPDAQLTETAQPIIRELLESVLDDDGVPGFKSQLYHYQRESVWKMLQRELLPQKLQDARLRKWIGPTGILSWINTDDMTFFRKQQYVDDIPGGILCEEMGTGKTVHSWILSLTLVYLSCFGSPYNSSTSITTSWMQSFST
jgi:SNF2 family DNA or RNA helicase